MEICEDQNHTILIYNLFYIEFCAFRVNKATERATFTKPD